MLTCVHCLREAVLMLCHPLSVSSPSSRPRLYFGVVPSGCKKSLLEGTAERAMSLGAQLWEATTAQAMERATQEKQVNKQQTTDNRQQRA